MLFAAAAGCDRVPVASKRPAPAQKQPASAPSEEPSIPVVLVDFLHAMRAQSDTTRPYVIDSCSALLLDGRRYAFGDPLAKSRTANAVQMLYGRSEYLVNWKEAPASSVRLDASTLHVLRGEPFSGFASGKRAVVAVGYRTEARDGKPEAAKFEPFWVGSILFK